MANSADSNQLASSEGRVYPGSAGQWLKINHLVSKLRSIYQWTGGILCIVKVGCYVTYVTSL